MIKSQTMLRLAPMTFNNHAKAYAKMVMLKKEIFPTNGD
jgi:hypothetical protein